MKAGIIGGTGRMGRLFVPVFERAGYDVLVSGRSTDTLGPRTLQSSCDLVIVSVPIRDTVQVIGEIAPVMSKDQLLCDFTSLKVQTGRGHARVKGKRHRAPPDVRAHRPVLKAPDHHRLPGPDGRDAPPLPPLPLPERRGGMHDHHAGAARPDDGRGPGAHPFRDALHGRLGAPARDRYRKDAGLHEPRVPDRALARGPAPLAGPCALCRHPPAEPLCPGSARMPAGPLPRTLQRL